MGIIKDNLYTFSGKWLLSAFRNQSVFPYYHLVRDDQVAHIANLYPYKNEAQFRKDLDLLLQYYQPIDPKDLLQNTKTTNAFLLSFDDGLAEIYSVIFPILQEKNIKAVFLVNPNFVDNHESLYKHEISLIIAHLKQRNFDAASVTVICNHLQISDQLNREALVKKIKATPFVDRHKIKTLCALLGIDIAHYLRFNPPYITKAQIAEMLEAGHYFGAHTMSHPPLTALQHEEQKAEIIESINWVKQHFGLDYAMFGFPFSDRGISKKLIQELFAYNPNLLIFGNSGLKKDISDRVIQRFSLEHPARQTKKVIVSENLYKIYNKLIGQYQIKRK